MAQSTSRIWYFIISLVSLSSRLFAVNYDAVATLWPVGTHCLVKPSVHVNPMPVVPWGNYVQAGEKICIWDPQVIVQAFEQVQRMLHQGSVARQHQQAQEALRYQKETRCAYAEHQRFLWDQGESPRHEVEASEYQCEQAQQQLAYAYQHQQEAWYIQSQHLEEWLFQEQFKAWSDFDPIKACQATQSGWLIESAPMIEPTCWGYIATKQDVELRWMLTPLLASSLLEAVTIQGRFAGHDDHYVLDPERIQLRWLEKEQRYEAHHPWLWEKEPGLPGQKMELSWQVVSS